MEIDMSNYNEYFDEEKPDKPKESLRSIARRNLVEILLILGLVGTGAVVAQSQRGGREVENPHPRDSLADVVKEMADQPVDAPTADQPVDALPQAQKELKAYLVKNVATHLKRIYGDSLENVKPGDAVANLGNHYKYTLTVGDEPSNEAENTLKAALESREVTNEIIFVLLNPSTKPITFTKIVDANSGLGQDNLSATLQLSIPNNNEHTVLKHVIPLDKGKLGSGTITDDTPKPLPQPLSTERNHTLKLTGRPSHSFGPQK
jgi:hypothetical protein